MTSFKTIAATAIIAVAGTVAAFGGLHLGQSGADAATTAQAAKARTTYAVSVTAKQRRPADARPAAESLDRHAPYPFGPAHAPGDAPPRHAHQLPQLPPQRQQLLPPRQLAAATAATATAAAAAGRTARAPAAGWGGGCW